MLGLLLLFAAGAGGIALLAKDDEPSGPEGAGPGGLTVGGQVGTPFDPGWKDPGLFQVSEHALIGGWDDPTPTRAGGEPLSVTEHKGDFDWFVTTSEDGVVTTAQRVFEEVELADDGRYLFDMQVEYQLGLTDPKHAGAKFYTWCVDGLARRRWHVQGNGKALPSILPFGSEYNKQDIADESMLCQLYFHESGDIFTGKHEEKNLSLGGRRGRVIGLRTTRRFGGFDISLRYYAPNPGVGPLWRDWYNGAMNIRGTWTLKVTELPW